jgi:hypothetical protein
MLPRLHLSPGQHVDGGNRIGEKKQSHWVLVGESEA